MMVGQQASMPVPDPTELTSRAVDALRQELSELFETKLNAQKELTSTRFSAVDERLSTAERLRLEQKVDTKTGLDAALAAQKDSAGQQAQAFAAETAKTERNFTEQLKGQRDTFGTAIAAQGTRYDDLDKRLTRIESVKIGGQETKTNLYAVLFAAAAATGVITWVITNKP